MTKILLVEDDKSLREIYGVRLLAEGYDIVSAGDGEEALAMAIKERPQLIVSDVMMPKISGFDMLDILRSTTETKDIRVIMMTALSSEDQRARGVALGADRYLVKSQVGIEDVVRTVHDVLGDAPVTGGAAAQTFAAPAAPRPAPAAPAPRPTPTASSYQQQMMAAAQPRVQPSPASATTQPAPQPTASVLPQPTAPFSTTRPANLGERIIHPISAPAPGDQKPDLGSLMDQELNSAPAPQPVSAPQPVAPIATPTPPPVPTPVFTPTPQPAPLPQPPTQPYVAPAPQSSPAPASQPVQEDTGISFEETPRTGAPAQSPFTPGPQPPTAG
jgi:CheY-like chemotaxis protein